MIEQPSSLNTQLSQNFDPFWSDEDEQDFQRERQERKEKEQERLRLEQEAIQWKERIDTYFALQAPTLRDYEACAHLLYQLQRAGITAQEKDAFYEQLSTMYDLVERVENIIY